VLKKRLIFTLLIDEDQFVLSRNFNLQKVGNIDWLFNNYNFSNISSYIDELIILNVRNKKKNFENFCSLIKKITKEVFIPIGAGGGIEKVEDVKKLLRSGADKVVLNSLLLENRNELNSKKQNEVKFLDHIKTIIDTNSTNAEAIMAQYQKDKNFFNINEK